MLYGCMLYDCMMYPLIRGVSYVIVEYSVWNENVGGGFHAAVITMHIQFIARPSITIYQILQSYTPSEHAARLCTLNE